MSAKSGIEWTDATWNPTVGCTKVSPGCDHCYAETLVDTRMHPASRARASRLAQRVAETNDGGDSLAVLTASYLAEQPFPTSFDVVSLRSDKFLMLPLTWQSPRRVFVNSLSDLFHKDVPDEFIARVFAIMALAGQHTFQLLTKRHARMRSLLSSPAFADEDDGLVAEWVGRLATSPCVDLGRIGWPLPNVWGGVSVEDQDWTRRVDALLRTPLAVRFLSVEPMLGPVRLCICDGAAFEVKEHPFIVNDRCPLHGAVRVDWVICGGESGPGARPMHPDWVRSLRDQCTTAGVPFLFKQWGNWAPDASGGVRNGDVCMSPDGDTYTVDRDYICAHNESEGTWLRNVGKKAAGRMLVEPDGSGSRTWDEYPATAL